MYSKLKKKNQYQRLSVSATADSDRLQFHRSDSPTDNGTVYGTSHSTHTHTLSISLGIKNNKNDDEYDDDDDDDDDDVQPLFP